LKGKIIKGIAGFYYIHVLQENTVYECKAKGIFRKQKLKPLVGDDVEIAIADQPEGKGIITDILPRKNELLRPAVANVDQVLVLFAAAEPEPNLNLLDRFLIMMQKQKVKAIVCFNKKDIVTKSEMSLLEEVYSRCGYEVLCISMLQEESTQEILQYIKGKTTVLAGPSGVGKSSLINRIQPNAGMETGNVSDKIKRGKHTTRHSELIYVEEDTYLMDTPGFSSLYIQEIEKEELKDYYIEFKEYEDACRFQGCMHLNEPGCAVKQALKEGKISKTRYKNYVLLFEEQKNQRKY
jgi:ribosome biogenesis GTPase